MRGRPDRLLALAAALAAVLAGCLGQPDGEPQEGVTSDVATDPSLAYQGTCAVALLFEFVDYAKTDEYLPPGFHPRDPQDFLTILPVALGQAGVIFLVLACDGPQGPADFASVGIFVEPPFVDGYEPGLFDFYEVMRYGTNDPFRPVLLAADWPLHDAEVEVVLDLDADAPDELNADGPTRAAARLTDADGALASFEGPAAFQVEVGDGPVRYWHEGKDGLGVLQIDVTLNARVGAGTCMVRAGTPLADFLEGTQCIGPGEPVIGTFPRLAIDAVAHYLDGVHAE